MKIGVLSDTHDRHDMVAAALKLLREHDPEVILHCGDITSCETVGLFEGDPVRFVFGNCDGDHRYLGAVIRDWTQGAPTLASPRSVRRARD